MSIKKHFLKVLLLAGVALNAFAQDDKRDMTAVTYEEIYDEPYAINKLFVGFQPLYGEVFATNVNAGYGLEAHFFYRDKIDFKAHMRKPYSRQFHDFNRDRASKVSDVDNRAGVFNYYEVGMTFHVKDFEENSKTKVILYNTEMKGNKWAAQVPLHADIPCKVRKIYGARLGGIFWDSSVDVNRVLEAQGLTLNSLKNSEGNGLPDGTDAFTNIAAMGMYLGGSMTWIKNVAVSFDKYESGTDDTIITTYFDILYSPSLRIDDIVYTPTDFLGVPIIEQRRTYDVSPIRTKSFGFRAGIEGKFNRTLSWSYGGEIGYRPSMEGQTFFAMVKISFPMYSTDLNYKVEAFGK